MSSPQSSPVSNRDVRRALHSALEEIRGLMAGVLPQPRIMMTLDREAELRRALRKAAGRVFRRGKAAQDQRGQPEDADEALTSLRSFFSMLRSARNMALRHLALAEAVTRHDAFYSDLAALKAEARRLLAAFERVADPPPPPHEEARALFAALRAAKARKDALEAPRHTTGTDACCKIFAAIFNELETRGCLDAVNREAGEELRAVSHAHIASSYVFDQFFYLSQTDDPAARRDAPAHYLRAGSGRGPRPNRFFDGRYYMESHDEARMLRYNALEHFSRYGDALLYNPCPEFDAKFYLESNEDVLDAGISAFKHFLEHGLREERPPSAKAAAFFQARYMDTLTERGIRLLLPDGAANGDRRALDMFLAVCATISGARVERARPGERLSALPAGFDGCIAGSGGIGLSRGDFPPGLADGGGRLVYVGSEPRRDLGPLLASGAAPVDRICAITDNYAQYIRWQESGNPLRLHYHPFADEASALPCVRALLEQLASGDGFAPRRFVQRDDAGPAISVVSIIYKKVREMLSFLESLNRQDIACPYEVILVDDASPDDAVQTVEAWLEQKRAAGLLNAFMRVSILRNGRNMGNCLSRNRGIEAAGAETVLVADGDVAFGASCLTGHCLAYLPGDCDAAVGFFRFNLDHDFVFDWLAACELRPAIVAKRIVQAGIHYSIDSIEHFVTRNVSFRKSALRGRYFDPAFSYSAAPDSGYGEEDHELALRLYFSGCRMRFVDSAIAIHIRHHDVSGIARKHAANLKNWNRLTALYPDLALVDRQFHQARTDAFSGGASGHPTEKGASPAVRAGRRVAVRKLRRLRILTHAWPSAYQYALCKSEHDFTLVAGKSGQGVWLAPGPAPYNARFAAWDDIRAAGHDLALVFVDASSPCGGQDDRDAARLLLDETGSLPKVAVCCDCRPRGEEGTEGGACDHMAALRERLRDIPVICDSPHVRDMGNFYRSSVIRRGFSPMEFPPGAHDGGCLLLPPSAGGRKEARELRRLLDGVRGLEAPNPPPPHAGYEHGSRERAVAALQNYARYLGKFYACLDISPGHAMPGTMREAMMTGCIPLVRSGPDIAAYIEHGVNGFCGESAGDLAGYAARLAGDAKERERMGKNARDTALDLFHIDRFLAAWNDVFAEIAG